MSVLYKGMKGDRPPAGNRICLVGNVNNAETLYQGTPEDVYKQARYAIDAGVDIIGPDDFP